MSLSSGSRNCSNIFPPLQNPRKRKLRWGMLFSLREIFKPTNELEISLKIVWLESRQRPAKIIALQFQVAERSRENPSP